ncbi:sigma-70 family RNA polymerase sigma factor [Marinomonas agarivorans]|nr:sigma-70 family RNA polymerase sigma factor [Marinomonas agarivorans]
MNKPLTDDVSSLTNDMAAIANQRDKQALSRVFDFYAPKIHSFCLASHPGATLMADDITQEVMIKIWNKAHTFNPNTASLTTWIFTIARNARIDYLRKNGRHQSNIDPEFIWDNIVDEDVDLFREAQREKDKKMIAEGLAQLPNEQRQVLVKVYLEGKTHIEAAQDLGIPLGTIKSRVRLALNKLSICIAR